MNINTILIVEDDKEIRQGVEIFLKGQGYRVLQAENGLEGLKVLEQETVDLAIVDGRYHHGDKASGEVRVSGYLPLGQVRGGR